MVCGATLRRLATAEAEALAAPQLAGRSAVVAWLRRDNAVLHLRHVLEAYGENRRDRCSTAYLEPFLLINKEKGNCV